VTGQQLNAKKTKCWATGEEERRSIEDVKIGEDKLETVRALKSLGVQLGFGRGIANKGGEERVFRGVEIAKRVLWAPLPMGARAELCSALVCQHSLYGVEGAGLTQNLLSTLRHAVLQAVWGTKRTLRAKELVPTLFVKGHLVDPQQHFSYRCLTMARKQLKKHEDLHEAFALVWQHRQENNDTAPGPVATLAAVVARLGWQWVTPFEFQRAGRPALHLLEGSDKIWQHEVREGLRIAEWRRAAERREDCRGLEDAAGVDKRATLALMSSKEVGPYQRGLLQGVMAGSLRLQERLHQAQLKDSPLCPFCEQGPESVEHCFWHCRRWTQHRQHEDLPAAEEVALLPSCTRTLGIFMEDAELVRLQDEFRGADETEPTRIEERTNNEAPENLSHTLVWTDGAARHAADCRLRRAGSGIWYGEEDPANLSLPLPGRDQTNQRAELFAVVKVLERDRRMLEVKTDSQYVVNGATSWQRWQQGGWQGDHADLWSRLLVEMRRHGADGARIVKVKGHATREDVRRGRVAEADKTGNDGADELAVAAARGHAVPPALVQAATKRRSHAKAVQQMFLSILEERFAEESGAGEEETMQYDELLADAAWAAGAAGPGAEDADSADADVPVENASASVATTAARRDVVWLSSVPVDTG